MIEELFRFFLANPGHLPERLRPAGARPARHRVVCDYIAGMTDVFFRRTYEQMLGPRSALSTFVMLDSSASRTP